MRAQCCICAELFVNNYTNIAATPCGHVFHEHCLARWLMSSKTCPSCRKKVVESAIIPKLYFDIAEEESMDGDPEKLSNELQTLRTKVTELQQKTSRQKEKKKALKEKAKKQAEELENVGLLLRTQQQTTAEQLRLLKNFEVQVQMHKEERVEFVRTKKKITELKHVDALISGSAKDCEELMQQYSCGDRSSLLQILKYAGILKREYEQIKVDKRTLKEQLDVYKKSSYMATRELREVKARCQNLQEQLTQSEEELKQTEKSHASLKDKLARARHARKHPAETSGSFLETPTTSHNLSDDPFTETPRLSLKGGLGRRGEAASTSTTTPKMSRPSGSSFVDLCSPPPPTPGSLNQSMDLFEESPQTQVRKACEENNMKVVRITSAATTAAKRKKTESREEDSFPLSTLNIMKKRDHSGSLFGSRTIIRKDYDGLGGTSSFVQPLGPPKFGSTKFSSKAKRPVKAKKKVTVNPYLPTLDGFIDLTESPTG